MNKKRKLATIILVFLATCSVLCACKKKPQNQLPQPNNNQEIPSKSAISFDEETITVSLGESRTLTPHIEEGHDGTIEWLTSDENVVTVIDGVFTAHNVGSATITASLGEYDKAFLKVIVTMIKGPAYEFSLTPAETQICIGDNFSFEPTLMFGDEKIANIGEKIIWTTENADIAEVANGVVTAKSLGETIITAKYTGENGHSLTAQSRVKVLKLYSYYKVNHYIPKVVSPNGIEDYTLYNVTRQPVGDLETTAAQPISIRGFKAPEIIEQQMIRNDDWTDVNIFYKKDEMIQTYDQFPLANEGNYSIRSDGPYNKYLQLDGVDTGITGAIVSDMSIEKVIRDGEQTKALKYVLPHGSRPWIVLPFSDDQLTEIKKGGKISFWVKTQMATSYASKTALVMMASLSEETSTYTYNGLTMVRESNWTIGGKENDDWAKIEISGFELGAKEKNISFYFWTPEGMDIYIDDFEVTPVTPYKVEHYLSKTRDLADGYSENPYETEILYGEIGDYTVAQEKEINGYALEGNIVQERISGSGDTIIKIYYRKISLSTMYRVRHYIIGTDNNETLLQEETLYGDENAQTEATAKMMYGYVARAIAQTPINPDGSTIVEIRYDQDPLIESFEGRATGGDYTGNSYKDGIATSGFKAAKIVSDENAFMGANGNTYITSTYLEGSTKMLYLANGNQGSGWIRIQLTDAQCAMYYAGGTLSFKYRLIADAGNGSVYTFTIGEQTGYKVDGETVTSITGINSNGATWHTVTMNVKDIPTLDGDSLLLRTVWASGANYAKNYDIWIDDIVVERPADATQGAYAVRHYVQTEMGGLEYTLRKTEYKSGTVGEQTEATALEIAGYTPKAIEQKTIGNEFIYVDVYYTRLALIDFEDGKADNVTVTGCAKSVKLKSDGFNLKNLLPESPDCYLGNAANGTRSLRVANTEKGAAQIRIELTAEQKEAVKNGGKISFVVWGRSVSTVDLKISVNGGEAKTLRTQLWATANQTIEIDVAAGTEYLTLDIAAAGTQWVLWLDDIVVK